MLTQLPNQGLFLKESSSPPASSALSSCEHVAVRTSVNAQLNSQLKIATLDLFSGSNHKLYLLTSFISHSVAPLASYISHVLASFISHSVALHISFFAFMLPSTPAVTLIHLKALFTQFCIACQFISHNVAHITDN